MRTAKKRHAVVVAVVAAGLLWAILSPAQSEKEDRRERGELLYEIHCMNCHGDSAEGDGPLAQDLKTEPSDLTVLSRANEGEFPFDEIQQVIDGRQEVRGHGKRDMPVWGLTFQDGGRPDSQEEDVKARILDLIAYLESVQDVSGED